MRSIFGPAVFSAAVMIVVSAPSTAGPTATLSGSLRDGEGGVIEKAFVLIHADGSGVFPRPLAGDLTIRSDPQGRFRGNVEPGFYDVCVMAQAFTPECRKVLSKEGGTVTLSFQLKIDPQVVRELGDKF